MLTWYWNDPGWQVWWRLMQNVAARSLHPIPHDAPGRVSTRESEKRSHRPVAIVPRTCTFLRAWPCFRRRAETAGARISRWHSGPADIGQLFVRVWWRPRFCSVGRDLVLFLSTTCKVQTLLWSSKANCDVHYFHCGSILFRDDFNSPCFFLRCDPRLPVPSLPSVNLQY